MFSSFGAARGPGRPAAERMQDLGDLALPLSRDRPRFRGVRRSNSSAAGPARWTGALWTSIGDLVGNPAVTVSQSQDPLAKPGLGLGGRPVRSSCGPGVRRRLRRGSVAPLAHGLRSSGERAVASIVQCCSSTQATIRPRPSGVSGAFGVLRRNVGRELLLAWCEFWKTARDNASGRHN